MADREIDALLNWQIKGDQTAKKSAEDIDKAVRNIKVDKLNKELQQTAKELDAARQAMTGLTGEPLAKAELKAAKLEERAARIVKQLQKLNDEANKTPKAVFEAEKAAAKEAAAFEKAAAAAEKLAAKEAAAAAKAASFEGVSKQVALRGDVESQARTITGAIGYVGGGAGGQIEQIANIGAEIFAVSEAIPKLGAALKDMATGAKVAQTGATAAAAAETATGVAATSATPGLLGMATAIGAVLLPVAAIGAVVGGAILAINALNAAEKRRKEAAEAAAKAIEESGARDADIENTLNRALAGSGSARQQLLNDYAQQVEQWDILQGRLVADQKGAITAANEAIGGLGKRSAQALADSGINIAEIITENLGGSEKELKNALKAAGLTKYDVASDVADAIFDNYNFNAINERARDLKGGEDYAQASGELKRYEDALRQLGLTAGEMESLGLAAERGAAGTAESLAELQAEAQASAAEVDTLNATLAGQQANVEQYNAQLISVQKSYDDRRADLLEDRSIKENRELEDWLEERAKVSTAHQKKLIDIEAQGQARVADLRGQMDSLASEVADSLGKLTTKTNDAVGKANADFMQSELKAVAKFHDDERKRIRDYNRQRLRDIEDWQNDLLDAEQANDVARFLQIERDGKTRLARQQEDQDTATADRDEAFFAERQAAQEALTAKLADIQAAAEQERAQLLETAGQKRAALQQAVEDEIVAIGERKQAEIDSYKASEDAANAAREKRMRRQAEDEALADARAEEALQTQLAAIEEKKRAELNAIDQTRQALIAAMQAVAKSASGLSGMSRASSSSKSSGSATLANILKKTASGSARVGPVRAFANEGYVTQPTVALMGESLASGEAEAAVKFKLNEGLAASILKRGGGGGGIIVNAPFTISNPMFGDIPTAQEVEGLFSAYHEQLTSNLEHVITMGRFSPQVN
jgi:hypothetical protein